MLLLGLIGLTLIFVRGSLLAPLRARLPVLGCARCFGFWAGLAGSIAGDPHVQAWLSWIAWAGAVSLCATAADLLLAWIDAHTEGAPRDAG